MYGDQFGEFVCGYWGLRVKSLTRSGYVVTVQIKPLQQYFQKIHHLFSTFLLSLTFQSVCVRKWIVTGTDQCILFFQVFNLNFHEVFSVSAEMHSVLCMVFNHSRDELITGGTGGMKVTDKAYMYISVAKQSRRKKSVFISIHVG